jgi:hypothetical protein
MRYLLAALVLALSACGSSSESMAPAPTPEPGRLVFKLDPATCTMYAGSPVNVALFVSSVPVDTLNMSPGDTASFSEAAGEHLVSARETVARGMVWPNALVTVPAGGVYTWLMSC